MEKISYDDANHAICDRPFRRLLRKHVSCSPAFASSFLLLFNSLSPPHIPYVQSALPPIAPLILEKIFTNIFLFRALIVQYNPYACRLRLFLFSIFPKNTPSWIVLRIRGRRHLWLQFTHELLVPLHFLLPEHVQEAAI